MYYMYITPVYALPELCVADRRQKKEIRYLEQELNKWQVLVDSVTGDSGLKTDSSYYFLLFHFLILHVYFVTLKMFFLFVVGISPPDFDNQTLAVLRGRLVRYLMRSREVSVLGLSQNFGGCLLLSSGASVRLSATLSTIICFA